MTTPIKFTTVTATLADQGRREKDKKHQKAITPTLERFARNLGIKATELRDANNGEILTVEMAKKELGEANTQAKALGSLVPENKAAFVTAVVAQAHEAGITEFTASDAIEALRFPAGIIDTAKKASAPVQDTPDPGLVGRAAKKESRQSGKGNRTGRQREVSIPKFLAATNQRDDLVAGMGYSFREGIDTEFENGVINGPELKVDNPYAILILTQDGRIVTNNLRDHVEYYGPLKGKRLSFKTMEETGLGLNNRHIVLIDKKVKEPPFDVNIVDSRKRAEREQAADDEEMGGRGNWTTSGTIDRRIKRTR